MKPTFNQENTLQTTFRILPSVAHDADSESAFTISAMDASAIARGVRKPALYSALAREPYKLNDRDMQ